MKHYLSIIVAILALLLIISACAPASAPEDAPPATATTLPRVPTVTPAASTSEEGKSVAGRLASQLGNELGAVVGVVSVEPAEWPDGCLGLPAAGEACTEAVVPGYLVVLEVRESQAPAQQRQYRTDADGSQSRMESSPVSPVMLWQREGGLAGFCDEVRVEAGGGVIVSSCGEVVSERTLAEEQSAALAAWMERYEPFETSFTDPATADALTVSLLFRGRGSEQAGAEVQEALALFASGLLPTVTEPPADAPALPAADQAGIYAAVIRQVYTNDHTFGQSPNFPIVYLLAGSATGPGAVEGEKPVLSPEVQDAVIQALADLPARWVWVERFDDVPRDAGDGRVADGGALITVGPIGVQDPVKVQVEGSVYVAPLVAGGQTYVLEQTPGGWTITGTTGAAWMS